MKRNDRLYGFIGIGVAFLLLIFSIPAAGQSRIVTLLHTNDMHAGFIPHEAFWLKQSPKSMIGGFAELAFLTDSIRGSKPGVILLDAGDVMTGNPVTEYEYNGVKGGVLFEMMNRIGYEAWCPGNHEFDISQKNLIELTRIAHFPTLCANLINTKNEFPVNNVASHIIEKNGVKIGIIGMISQVLYTLVNQNNLTGLKVLSPVETAQKLIDELGPKVDIVVALTHHGFEEDSALAAGVRGLHVIVGGHSHTRLFRPREINGTIIVQAGSNCEYLGELQLSVGNKRVISYRGLLHPLWKRPDRAISQVARIVDSVNAAIAKDYNMVIAEMSREWSGEGSVVALGNLVTDAQREAAHAHVAFMNLHGIRRGVGPGPITKMDLFEVLPFKNLLTVFQLTGSDIRSIMQYHLENKTPVIFAGLSCRWRGTRSRIKILSLEIGGNPVRDEAAYICTASDYFVSEAERYIGMELRNVTYLQRTIFDAAENKLRSGKLIKPNRDKNVIRIR